MNRITTALVDEVTDDTTLVGFARSHAFGAILRAFKDPEYDVVGMGALADSIAALLRRACLTSESLPVVYGNLQVTDKQNDCLVLSTCFIWAHTEKALNSQGYCAPAEKFVPLLRDNDEAPLLRITGLALDEDYFSECASNGMWGPEDFHCELAIEPMSLDPEWLAGRCETAGGASEPSDSDPCADPSSMPRVD